MTSTPSPVWPGASEPARSPGPRSANTLRLSNNSRLVAMAFVGVVIGFAGSQALDHSLLPPSLSSSITSLEHRLGGGGAAPVITQPAQPAQPAQAAQPATNPNPFARGGRTSPRGANPAPAQGTAGSGANAAPAPAAAASGANGSVATTTGLSSDPTQAAVQQAIQSIDDAQASAVQSNDLSGLSAAATPDFASQQQSVTQDLLDNGVTGIQLVNIEWGPVNVSGTTATATAFETWRTTYDDGTTEQSRDRNEYTLVQQDGNWQVQSDEHPDAGLPGGLLPGGQQSIPGIPSNLLPPGFTNPFGNP